MKLPSSIIHELVRPGGSTSTALRMLHCFNELLFGAHQSGGHSLSTEHAGNGTSKKFYLLFIF